jgi:hypothetical protein
MLSNDVKAALLDVLRFQSEAQACLKREVDATAARKDATERLYRASVELQRHLTAKNPNATQRVVVLDEKAYLIQANGDAQGIVSEIVLEHCEMTPQF